MNKKDIKEFEMKEKDGKLYIRLPENYYEVGYLTGCGCGYGIGDFPCSCDGSSD